MAQWREEHLARDLWRPRLDPSARERDNALARLPELAAAEHLQVRSALRCNNRVEQAHQFTRVRECVMRRFRSPASTQRFLDAFTRVGNLFRPGRHRLTAVAYRATMQERVATWREVAGLRAA
jgi:putative transposase